MFSPSRFLVLILVLFGGVALAAEPKRDRFGDPLPEGAVARLGSLRLRGEHPILMASFSADDKSLFLGETNSLTVWEVKTGKMVRRLAHPKMPVARVRRLTADGKTLILSGYDNILRFVDTATGKERSTLNHASHNFIQALDVSRDGKVLVAVHAASIALWNVPEGKLLHEFKGPHITPLSPYHLVALTADGKQLVLPHSDGSLHLLDVASGKKLRSIETPTPRPGVPAVLRLQRLVVSPDGRYLAYGGPSDPVTLCDLATGKRLREVMPAQGILSGLAFTPNGRFLAVHNYTGLRLFGVLSGKEIRNLPAAQASNGTLAFSPDGRLLATTRGGYTINLWDLDADRPVHPLIGHEGVVHSLAFFPDGKRLVSNDFSGGMMVWDIGTGRELARRKNTMPALSLTVEEDGETVRFAGYDVAAHRWEPRSGREEKRPALAGISTNQVALSPDGRSLAVLTVGQNRRVRVYELKNSKASVELALPENVWVSQMVFAPDSRRMATASNDGMLRLWDRDTGKLVREFAPETPGRQAQHLAFAADGRSLAFSEGTVCIRELVSGGKRVQITLPFAPLSLAYAPGGRFLACGMGDGRIAVYGTISGKQLALWEAQQGAIRSLAFSRDGRQLASGGENGTILVWKVPKSEELPASLKADEVATLWQGLADEDAGRANRALAALAAAPAQAVPLIQERFRVVGKPPSPERLAQLIAQLDDDSFKVRQRAMRELAEAGPDAADALRRALANDPSVETKGRIEQLLARLSKGGDPERLRSVRAIEVLERIGTPQAKDVLRGLLAKSLPPALAEEARGSLMRLGQRR